MDVKIKVTNKDQVMKIYTDESGFHIPTIAMRALKMTADQVKQALVDEMNKSLDRPTPYTLSAPYIKALTAKVLNAQVLLKQGRSEGYLLPQVYGGARKLKSFESALRSVGVLPDGMYAVPGRRAPLNAYGNISPGFIVQILSYFKAFSEKGHRANITDEKKAKMATGTKKKRGIEYFAVKINSGSLAPGIYRRTSFSFGNSVEPMIMFVKKPAYRRILKWDQIAQRVVDQNWEKNFKEAETNP